MPATTGYAEWAPRPARSAPAPRSAEAVAHPRLPVFRRRRYRTSLLPGRSRRELPSTILHDAMCARRMAWLRNSRRHRYAAEGSFYQPTDQTNGGPPPPGPALIVTGIWRPQPAARPSSNPVKALVHAGG